MGDDRELVGFPGDDATVFEGAVYGKRRQVASIHADAYPVSAGYGLPSACPDKQYRRCGRREVDGHLVLVARDRQPWFPGTEVVFAGTENVVRVQWQRSGDEGDDPELEALIALVTDPRWQT